MFTDRSTEVSRNVETAMKALAWLTGPSNTNSHVDRQWPKCCSKRSKKRNSHPKLLKTPLTAFENTTTPLPGHYK